MGAIDTTRRAIRHGAGPARTTIITRRGALRVLAAGAAGTAIAVAPGRQPTASAADGDPVQQGSLNEATTATTLEATDESALRLWSGTGYGVETDGTWGNARFVAGGETPVGTLGYAGVLWVDGDGNWWGSTRDSDTDAHWRKLAGPATAGALHMLPTPVRVYDSRPGEAPNGGTKSPLPPNRSRTVDVTRNRSGVPAGARAALVTLTVTNTAAPGYVAAWPSGTWPGTSTINFGTAQSIATTTVVGLDGITFLVQSNTSTDVVVDVVGYYQ